MKVAFRIIEYFISSDFMGNLLENHVAKVLEVFKLYTLMLKMCAAGSLLSNLCLNIADSNLY